MRRTKAEADETRLRILDAAEVLFFQHGVSETTLDQIAKTAGVTRGAVYHHYTDKAQLLQEIFDSIPLPHDQLARLACERGGPCPFTLIEQSTLHGIRHFASDDHQQRVFAIFVRIGLLDNVAQGAKQPLMEAYGRQRAQLLEIFTYACDAGLMNPNWTPEAAEGVLSRWLSGLWHEWIMSHRSFDIVGEAHEQVRRLVASFRR